MAAPPPPAEEVGIVGFDQLMQSVNQGHNLIDSYVPDP
jgi:hypothetical protein